MKFDPFDTQTLRTYRPGDTRGDLRSFADRLPELRRRFAGTATAVDAAVERRAFKSAVKLESSGEKSTVTGYAAIFDSPSVDLGGFVEIIGVGAFKKVLASGADVRCLLNSDPSVIFGRTRAGTLRLSEDSRGLRYECDLPDTTDAHNLRILLDRGDISQSSFGFSVAANGDSWTRGADGPVRTINEVAELMDVGPCTFPKFVATEIALRSLMHALEAAELSDLASVGPGNHRDSFAE